MARPERTNLRTLEQRELATRPPYPGPESQLDLREALEVVRLRPRPHRLELLLANRGNVTETIARRCFVVTVRRARRVVVRLHPTPRRILPHAFGLIAIPFRGARGPLRVAVALSPGPPCPKPPSRAFVVRPEKGMRN